jgi:hypothetical protein
MLIIACSAKYVRKLATTPLVSCAVANKAGLTPLMLAVQSEKMELLESVLAAKPDVNAVDLVRALWISSDVFFFVGFS